MRYVPLREAEPGMVLAADLYDSVGRTLIGCHCELTESYLEKLEAYGFDGIYIEDKLSEGITIESVITPQLRQEGQERIRACDIDGCKLIARRMVEEILSCGNVSLDLTDLRSYDDYTYAHSVNVAVYCGVIGMGMGMSEVELGHLVTAALLHDLGKLQIPDEILNKPGRLTQEEYLIMKSHATLSYQIISERWDISAHIKEAVLHHHENVDGSGYPDGLEGAQQTMFTRILHVADVYDALTSRRPYKEPYAPYEATEYLMGGCGIMFDREVVETLLKYVPLYPKGTMVTLSDGREAIIYENFGVHNLRPVVRLMDGELLDLSNEANYHITLRMKTESGFSTEEAEKKIDGIAFHWYTGDHFEALAEVRNRFPEKELIFTEGCVEYSRFASDNQVAHAEMYAHDILGNFNAGMNAYLDWNIYLDELGGPNHVKNYCDAPVMCDTKNDTIDVKLSYYYIGHFSRFIKRGAKRMLVSRFTSKVEACGFVNPDGEKIMILLNCTDDTQAFTFCESGMKCDMEIPAHSIQTLCW